MAENGLRCDEQWLALRMARAVGVSLVEIASAYDGNTLVVLGSGAGITMAACDHLVRCYPGLGIMAADLPGSMGLTQRVVAMDYLGAAFPSVWLLWSGLADAAWYARALRRRAHHSLFTWLYLRGLGSERAGVWNGMNVHLIDDLWSRRPLGDRRRLDQIIRNAYPCARPGEPGRE